MGESPFAAALVPSGTYTNPSASTVVDLEGDARKKHAAELEAMRRSPDYVFGSNPETLDLDRKEVQRTIENAIQRGARVEWDMSRFTPELQTEAIDALVGTAGDPERIKGEVYRASGVAAAHGKPFTFNMGHPAIQEAHYAEVRKSGAAGKVISGLNTAFNKNIIPGQPTQRLAANYALAPERMLTETPSVFGSSLPNAGREFAGQFVSGLASPAGILSAAIPEGLLAKRLVGDLAGKSALSMGLKGLGKSTLGAGMVRGAGAVGRAAGNIPLGKVPFGPMWQNIVKNAHGEIPETLGAVMSPAWGKSASVAAEKGLSEQEFRTMMQPIESTAEELHAMPPEVLNAADRIIEARKRAMVLPSGEVAPANAEVVSRYLRMRGLSAQEPQVAEAISKIQGIQTTLADAKAVALRNAKLTGQGDKSEIANEIARLTQRRGRYGAFHEYVPEATNVAQETGPAAAARGLTENMRATLLQQKGSSRALLPFTTRFLHGTEKDARLIAAMRSFQRMRADQAASSGVRAGARSLISTREQLPAMTRMIPRNPEDWGALSGRYMADQPANQVMAMTSRLNVGNPTTRRFMQTFKKSNTVLSPGVHVANEGTNLSVVNQTVPLHRFPDVGIRAWKNLRKMEDPRYQQAQRMGLFSNTSDLDPIIEQGAKYGTPGEVAANLGRKGPGVTAMASEGYQLAEQHAKAMIFQRALDMGKSVEDAVALAQKHLFDYQDISDSMKIIRSSPIGVPFLTFPLKAAKLIGQTVADKPYQLRKFMLPSEAITKYNVDQGRLNMGDIERTKELRAKMMEQRGGKKMAFLERVLPRTVVGSRTENGRTLVKTINPLRASILGITPMPRGGQDGSLDLQVPIGSQLMALAGKPPSSVLSGDTPEIVPDAAGLASRLDREGQLASRLRAFMTLLGASSNPYLRTAGELGAAQLPYQLARVLMAKRTEHAGNIADQFSARTPQAEFFRSDTPTFQHLSGRERPTSNEIGAGIFTGTIRSDADSTYLGRIGMNKRARVSDIKNLMRYLPYRGAKTPNWQDIVGTVTVPSTDPGGE